MIFEKTEAKFFKRSGQAAHQLESARELFVFGAVKLSSSRGAKPATCSEKCVE
jgi:hypothetical protein